VELVRHVVDYLAQGGWLMIPLGACSLVMWSLIADRWLVLRGLGREDVSLARAVDLVRDGGDVPVRSGLRATLVNAFGAERSGRPEVDAEVLRACARRLRPELRRSLAVIAVLAAVAPLLGLLGTVTGMIETFDVIAIFGTGNARAMAGGISVALVTTQSGLLVAIPGLVLAAVLARRARRLEMRLDEAAAVLARHVAHPRPGGGEPS
jgi:biopolymer transport protein ExbB